MSGLALRNITKAFGAIKVIDGVDLDIAPSEFVVFVGPSGCGKSTLLRLIAGLDDPDDGSILIGGTDVTGLEPVERSIAMVFQSYALYPHMSVEQNMGFGLKVTGIAPAEIKRRVLEAATSLQLEPYLLRKPAHLSGGQRQRVAIGRAMVRNPQVFLFDEPLSNLDAELRVHMRIEIARLHKRLKSTMIYVTHDQVEAMTLADKIVVLQGGRIEQVGTPLTLYDDPENLFVAGFIGSPKMNFLEGQVVSIDNGLAAVQLDANPECVAQFSLPGTGLVAGQMVTLGIRPEHLTLGAGQVTLRVQPDVVENLGVVSYLHALTARGTAVVAELRGRPDVQSSGLVDLSFDPARALLFDSTGRRLRPKVVP